MKRFGAMGVVAAALLLIGVASAQDATLQEVLEKHYEAIGGLDAWKGLQTIKISGKMSMGGLEAPVTMSAKRPDKIRIDFVVQGVTGTQAYDGDTAWMFMPFMGKTDPEEMPADQAKGLIEQADIDGPLIGYQEEGLTVEMAGKEDVEGTSAYKIKVTRPSGDVTYLYLDSEYYVPIRMEGTRQMQGQELEYEVTLSDYKEVGGLLMAHAISSKAKGAPAGQILTLETIETGVALDDAQFKMPKKAAEPPQ